MATSFATGPFGNGDWPRGRGGLSGGDRGPALGRQPAPIREDEQAKRKEENARKLYMAMTRAGQRLAVVSSQRAPETIERVFERRPCL